jgi:hypothetical protein
MVTRIDLAELLAARRPTMGARIDLGNTGDINQSRHVAREGKGDRLDTVEVSGIPKGMMREAIGQALLMGYGDDVEGFLTDRNAGDVKRERQAFADEHPYIAAGSYAGGIVGGLGLPKAVQALSRYGRAGEQIDDTPFSPRMEPDLRQAMRNADQALPADEAAAGLRDRLEVLLNPRAPTDANLLPPSGIHVSEPQPGGEPFGYGQDAPPQALRRNDAGELAAYTPEAPQPQGPLPAPDMLDKAFLTAARAYDSLGLSDAPTKLYTDVVARGRRDPITEKDIPPEEIGMLRRVLAQRLAADPSARSGSIGDEDYARAGVDKKGLLGKFDYQAGDDGGFRISDTYDFNMSDLGPKARDASMVDRVKTMFSDPVGYAGYVGAKVAPDTGGGVPVNIFIPPEAPAEAPPARDTAEADPLAGMSPVDVLRLQQELPAAPDASTAARNRQSAQDMLLDVTPIIGNVRSGMQAVESAGKAGDAFGRGEVKQGLLESALAALGGVGAIGGLPLGKWADDAVRGASSRANVLLPAPPSRAVERALEMRANGGTNAGTFRETGRFFGPEGQPRIEISDRGAVPTLGKFSPGDTAPMRDVINHPALYGARPDLGEIPVRMTPPYAAPDGPKPIARSGSGGLELSLDGSPEWTKANIAKLLQYEIAKDAGFGSAVTHKTSDMLRQYDDAIARVSELPGGGARDEWLDAVTPMRDRLAEAIAGGNKGQWKASKAATNNTAGNADVGIVKARATISDEGMRAHGRFPYNTVRNWSGNLVLPQPGMTREEIAQMLANWQTYGAGRGG